MINILICVFHDKLNSMPGPEKRVKSESDLALFQRSPAYSLICFYLEKLCLSVKGHINIPSPSHDPSIASVLNLILKIRTRVEVIEPIHQPMRFGNKAFRHLHEWLCDNADVLLLEICEDDTDLTDELKPYLLDAFGNPIRIDYGTGHEAAFLCFLIVLMERQFVAINSYVVLAVFREYIKLVRLITTKYMMEPAGSHGVWGLDDYHHLPFLFGAAQLIGHESELARPSDMLARCQTLSDNCLYAECIEFIKRTKCKHAPLHEVAPLLHDFSRMDNWSLVCYGLMQMYKAEVLAKWPIVQHFYFGNTIRWS